MKEMWKPVPNFEGYEVSDKGQVRSIVFLKPGIRISQNGRLVQGKGYLQVTLTNRKTKRIVTVHRLVLETFKGPSPTPQHMACHLNEDPWDNWPENLVWGTAKDNARHRTLHGNTLFGERNPLTKLSTQEVKEIRQTKGIYAKDVGEAYGVSEVTIHRIRNGKTWKTPQIKARILSNERIPDTREAWRVVPEFPLYKVSNRGRVKRTRILKPRITGSKTRAPVGGRYRSVALYNDKGRCDKLIHHLALEVFYKGQPKGMQACHYDGNPANNEIKNLGWVTPEENMAHKVVHGTHQRGEKSARSKLTNKQVIEMRKRILNGERVVRLAAEFGISPQTIYSIKSNRTYKEEYIKEIPFQ